MHFETEIQSYLSYLAISVVDWTRFPDIHVVAIKETRVMACNLIFVPSLISRETNKRIQQLCWYPVNQTNEKKYS